MIPFSNALMMAVGIDAYDADAAAYFSAMPVQPNDTRKALINTLIVGLKADGVWPLLQTLWLFAAHDGPSGLINACMPGTYNATVVGGVTFATDRGQQGNGSTGEMTTGGYSTAIMPANRGHLSVWVNATTGGANYSLQPIMDRSSAQSLLNTYDPDGNASGRVKTNVDVYAASPGRLGFKMANRTASNDLRLVIAGVSGSAQTSSNSESTGPVLLLHGGNYVPDRIAAASCGDGMTPTQATAFYNRLNTYLAAIGAQ